MNFEAITPYLNPLDSLLAFSQTEKGDTYAQPALKHLGSVVFVVLREVISPASFRNAEAEVTDIDVNGRRHIRAIANKFKFGERARGLQVLRYFHAGGASAQNKTAFAKGEKPSARFDLNALVFGDSANHGSKVLPVKAAAQYSDAVSLQDYADAVDLSFHICASEDGSLWDAQKKENSSNLFERHFVKPGALLLQTVSFNGKVAPLEAVEHWLLSLGLAGAYGGATSIYGVNVRNHLVGCFAAHLERDLASPYVAIEALRSQHPDAHSDPVAMSHALQAIYRAAWPVEISGSHLTQRQRELITQLESNAPALRERYTHTAAKVANYFDAWFEGIS